MNLTFRIFGLFALLLLFPDLDAQRVTIKGRIIDKRTLEPVISATISIKASNRAVSDADGRFVIVVEKLPVTLSVSHVSYGLMSVTVSNPSASVVIRLEPIVNQLPEARISAGIKKVQILNPKTRYTIIDYQFEDPYMWFIGCMDNSPKGTRLWLGDPYGETYSSIPITKDDRLYRDVFGKVHLIGTDTVYQLFNNDDSIHLIYPEAREKFMSVMGAFEVAFGDGLARLEYNSSEDELWLVFKDPDAKKPRVLNLKSVQEKGYLERRYALIGRYLGVRTLNLMINQQKEQYLQKMSSSLFVFSDTLYAINLKDNQLHAFDTELNETRVIPFTFHFKETDDITDAYIPFRIITDRVKFKVYVVFNINSHYSITPLNTQSGLTGPELVLPRYSAMDKISIHNNTLYYIYPEKIFPYYQRLFSMVLD